MKRTILAISLCLLCLSAAATNSVVVLWLNMDASSHDKLVVRDGLYTMLNDNTKISTADLPVWELISNTNIAGWVCSFDIEWIKNRTNDVSHLTIDKLNAWRDNNLDTPNHLQWRAGDNALNILSNENLEARDKPRE